MIRHSRETERLFRQIKRNSRIQTLLQLIVLGASVAIAIRKMMSKVGGQ